MSLRRFATSYGDLAPLLGQIPVLGGAAQAGFQLVAAKEQQKAAAKASALTEQRSFELEKLRLQQQAERPPEGAGQPIILPMKEGFPVPVAIGFVGAFLLVLLLFARR